MIRRAFSNGGSRIRVAAAIRNCWHLGLCIVLSLAGAVSARYSSPTAAGAAGRGTVPPSSYGSGLVTMPSPVDNTSNSVITGNVSGGKAFRGNIPYSSTTSFGGRLASTSLDPFLRYSAVPEELRDGASDYTPFYSPTGTVAKIPPGSSGVFAPSSPKVAGVPMQFHAEQPTDMVPSAEATQPQFSPGPMGGGRLAGGYLPSPGRPPASLENAQLWSTKTSEEMRRLVAGEPGDPSTERQPAPQSRQIMTSEEYQRQLEHLQQDFDRVKTTASRFEQDLQAGRQTPTQAMLQKSVEPPAQPMLSTESLRKIFQPQNETPAVDLTPGQGQRANSAPFTLDGSAAAGQAQGQTVAAGPSNLVLVSPPSPATGTRAAASSTSGFELYGQPAGSGQSPSELAAQRSRIDAIFAPQTEGAATENSGGDAIAPRPRAADPAIPWGQAPAPQLNTSRLGSSPPAKTGVLPTQAGTPAMQRVEEIARAVDAPGQLIEHPLQDSTGSGPSSAEPVPEPTDRAPAASSNPAFAGTTTPAPKPRSLEGVAPTRPPALDTASQKKFNSCMTLAQVDMQQGRYSRAAESFALASVYNPTDAKSQIGRSRALLAAGEYLGSAVSLAKAIELDPRLTLMKSDLVEAIGGPDQFIQRITDLQQRAETNSAPGLQLLLAYVYQQMDRPDEARIAVHAAKQGLPTSLAVNLLQAAIEGVAPG
ncbi:MAG: hypothetical protein NTZ17_20530 [Phycisphaerae bacterium]|nr:hypothetical protein [Phycisphaerae bacterium]